MKTVFAALAALTFTAGAAAAGSSVPGYIFVQADKNNDGVLSAGELDRAQELVTIRDRDDR